MTEVAPPGLRWPAEWEPHAATWLAWPHAEDTWPGRLPAAETAFVEMVRALHGQELVCISVQDEAGEERVRRRLGPLAGGCRFHRFPTDDAWVRDHGPIFLSGADGAPCIVDFDFDAWGGKYPPWTRDADIPRRVAEQLGVACHRPGFVLEGGSVDGNGAGTVLTTTSCLLNPNREAGRTREGMEARLRDWLGATHVIWLSDGIVGDDTDGHVDDIARFVSETTVVAVVEPDPGDPNHAPLAHNLQLLRQATDAAGRRLEVVALPMPPPLVVDGVRCPASYANFYLANARVLLPVFGVPEDAHAIGILRDLLPGREVVPIPSRDLVAGLGAVHCLTQQQPA